MPRNDRSDSLSVREKDDERRLMKGMQQETELELGSSEARDTGGVEHQSREDREGVDRRQRPAEQAAQRVSGEPASRHPADPRSAPGQAPVDDPEEATEIRDAPDAPGANEHP